MLRRSAIKGCAHDLRRMGLESCSVEVEFVFKNQPEFVVIWITVSRRAAMARLSQANSRILYSAALDHIGDLSVALPMLVVLAVVIDMSTVLGVERISAA